jgi:hypothetical protein
MFGSDSEQHLINLIQLYPISSPRDTNNLDQLNVID